MQQFAAVSAQGLIDSIAMVNTRLYGQLLAQGRSDDDLWAIRRAYDLTSVLYSGAYQADGRPFTAHAVSVASILALIGMPSNIVAAALIHNVYGNGDFGDGRYSGVTPQRRQRVRDAVGDDIESCVHRFSELRLTGDLQVVKSRIGWMSERDRMILAIELADLLDKFVDLSVLYFGNADWVTQFVDAHEYELINIGYALGQPVLADALTHAIAQVRSRQVPAALRQSPERRYVSTIIPLSCIERPELTWTKAIKQSVPWRFARRVIRGTPA
jgi:hypothetical protein